MQHCISTASAACCCKTARVREDLQRHLHLLVGAQLQCPEHEAWSVWLLAATARPLQSLTAMRMSGLVSIAPHSEVTACRCKLFAKAASEHRINHHGHGVSSSMVPE